MGESQVSTRATVCVSQPRHSVTREVCSPPCTSGDPSLCGVLRRVFLSFLLSEALSPDRRSGHLEPLP